MGGAFPGMILNWKSENPWRTSKAQPIVRTSRLTIREANNCSRSRQALAPGVVGFTWVWCQGGYSVSVLGVRSHAELSGVMVRSLGLNEGCYGLAATTQPGEVEFQANLLCDARRTRALPFLRMCCSSCGP
eukprot:3917404-Amphidinium_carterae.1